MRLGVTLTLKLGWPRTLTIVKSYFKTRAVSEDLEI